MQTQPVILLRIPSPQKSMVVTSSFCGDVSLAGAGKLVRMEGAKYKEIIEEKCLSIRDWGLAQRLTPWQDSDPKHSAEFNGFKWPN